MACADADALTALVEGTLDDDARRSLAIHAASCETCHDLLDALLDGRGESAMVGPGTAIGRYIVDERIGAGGMGVVYAATDSELRRRVAVKLVRGEHAGETGGTQGRERLLREARVLARLSHPNVVTVFDVGTYGDDVFLAMELVDGGNLTAWLKRAPRTLGEIVDCLIAAGRGLAAAHAAGIVHRDVKPDNILVGNDGRVLVTDFGLAHEGDAALDLPRAGERPLWSSLTRTGALMGTPVYMAPEQLRGGKVEARTDQWAFCAMLYEAVAGVRPFGADDFAVRKAEIEAGRLAPPVRSVPAWLLKIITRGLRADPAQRWDSMAVVVAALVRGRHRRARAVRVALGAVALAATATTIVVLTRHHEPPQLTEDEKLVPPVWKDARKGCDCPYSACDGKCLSQCNMRAYTKGTPVPGINVVGHQNAVIGASLDGNTILYLSGESCALDRLMLAHRRGDTYVPVDLTDQLDRKRVKIYEGCCTLAPDGRSVILARVDRAGFERVRIGAGDKATLDDTGEMAALLPSSEQGLFVRHPIMSGDELTLYYRLFDRRVDKNDQGVLEGTYASTRTDRDTPFRPGRRLPGRARTYEYVTGVSADGLSLFMASDFATHVLVRTRTDQPFGDPGANIGVAIAPAMLPGWRAIPVEGCKRILTTWTPGGCEQEMTVWLEGQ